MIIVFFSITDVNTQRLRHEEMENIFQELNNHVINTRDDLKSYFRELIKLRVIDNCDEKKINHRKLKFALLL